MFLVARDFLIVLGIFLSLMLVLWMETSSVDGGLSTQREALQTSYVYPDQPQERSARPAAY